MTEKTPGQAAHKLPKLHAHPDDYAEEWLAEEFEPDDDPNVGVSYDREHMINAYHAGWDQARKLTAAALERQRAGIGDGQCCDLHGRNCEPPSELCCENCTEARHAGWTDERGTRRYGHPRGETCSNPDLSAAAGSLRAGLEG